MANKFTTFRKINKNRFRKIYPINHVPAVEGFTSDKGLVVETKTIEVNDEEFISVILDGKYTSVPAVMASIMSFESNEFSNVNVFISSIAMMAGEVSLTIGFSSNFTGQVGLQVIEIS